MIDVDKLKVGDIIYYGFGPPTFYKIVVRKIYYNTIISDWLDLIHDVHHLGIKHAKADYHFFPIRPAGPKKKFEDFL